MSEHINIDDRTILGWVDLHWRASLCSNSVGYRVWTQFISLEFRNFEWNKSDVHALRWASEWIHDSQRGNIILRYTTYLFCKQSKKFIYISRAIFIKLQRNKKLILNDLIGWRTRSRSTISRSRPLHKVTAFIMIFYVRYTVDNGFNLSIYS